MYEIKVLSNDEFDRLPQSITRGAEISDSLGFADKRTGKAYVRYTSHPDLQKYLINHEFEELEADYSTHEDEFGIRHKKFWKDILAPMLTMGVMKPEKPMRDAAQTQAPISPMSLFGFSQAPSQGVLGGSSDVSGGLNQGLENLTPEEQERKRGFYSGRIAF